MFSQTSLFVLWIIIAKVFSPSQIGVYVLTIFIVDFFSIFALFGLHSAITRFYYSEEKNEAVFFNALAMIVVTNILSFAVLFFSTDIILWLLPETSEILGKDFLLFFALIVCSCLYSFGLSHYAALKKVFWYSVISVLQTISLFIFFILFLILHFGVLGILWALLISYAVPTIFFLIKEIKNLSANAFSFKIIKSLFNYAFPMMLYTVFGVVVMYAGRIFLNKYTNLSTLGLYSFFLLMILQVNALWATFNKAWTPEIFSELKNNREKALENVKLMAFLTSFVYLLFFAVFIIFKNIGLFNPFLKLIYLSNIYIFYLLLIGPLFTGIYTAAYPLYYYEKKTKIVLLISVALNIIDIFLAFFMVKYFNELGAALAFSISSALSTFAFLFAFQKTMKIPKEIIKFSVVLFLIMVFSSYVFLTTSSDILLFVIVVFSAILTYRYGQLYKKKYFLLSFLKNVKNKFVFSKN